MEKIIGLKLELPVTETNIQISSRMTAAFLRYITETYPITFNQILYPYADALSISLRPGTESTAIFGTHLIFRSFKADVSELSFDIAARRFFEQQWQSEPELPEAPKVAIRDFSLTEGSAVAEEIHEFLKDENQLTTVGNYGKMLSGFVPHWRIREASKVFASFSEMAYRRSKGLVCGLSGGKLVLKSGCDCVEALTEIFFQKTGGR